MASGREDLASARDGNNLASLIFYSAAYVGAAHHFDTTRKAGWVAASLSAHPIAGVSMAEPAPLTADEIAAVHDRTYVDAVRTGQPRELATSSGLGWDAGVWNAVCASNGGAVAAVLHAWRSRAHAGSLSSGLHHASMSHGAAFCTFNGLALAAHAVLAAGAKHVLVLDLDAHCGGGTYRIVHEWPGVVQLDIAVSGVDRYPPDPAGHSTLDLVDDADRYLPTLRRRLSALSGTALDVVIYNAGMDVHEELSPLT